MDFIGIVVGVAFAFLVLGTLGIITLFISCDAAAEKEKKRDLKNR